LNINGHWSCWLILNSIKCCAVEVRVFHCLLFFG
jgi:hypothetical protein